MLRVVALGQATTVVVGAWALGRLGFDHPELWAMTAAAVASLTVLTVSGKAAGE